MKNLPDKAKEALPDLVQRYINGESIQTLAKDSGVARRTIYNWFLTGLGDTHYHDLVTQVLASRVADADEALERAADSLHIARAREQTRLSRMDLERRRPELYGSKQEVRHVTPEPLRIVTIVANAQQIAPQHGNNGLVIDVSPSQSVDK